MTSPHYRDFSDFLARHFNCKIQKITVNAGFTCPNRDGTKGTGGCIYCNNQSFNPGYCAPALSVSQQLNEGKKFFARKYPDMKYLAYFQAYTNTHGEIPRLLSLYREALAVDGVVGLIIGTRPDCMPQELLDELKLLRYEGNFIMIEYGAESSHDQTLRLVNRCHTWSDTVDAVSRTYNAGLPVGLHIIMGLPGESEEMMLTTIDRINTLPIDTLKIHQLQVIKGTRLALAVSSGEIQLNKFTVDEYITLCVKIIHRIRPDIAIERFVSQSPDELLISPRWGLKNYQFTDRLRNALKSQ